MVGSVSRPSALANLGFPELCPPTYYHCCQILSYTFGNDVSDTVTLELSCSLDSVSRELARYLLTLLVRRDFREIVA